MRRYVQGRAYGYGDEKPIRSLSEDVVKEKEKSLDDKLLKMEERIKKHTTECKREIIKELLNLLNIPSKEKKNGSKQSKGRESN